MKGKTGYNALFMTQIIVIINLLNRINTESKMQSTEVFRPSRIFYQSKFFRKANIAKTIIQ